MNRFKILALLATVALLALVPVALFAQQPDTPHQFYGTATLEGGTLAPDGTVVAALLDGVEVATTEVESSFQDGFYLLRVGAAAGDPTFAGGTVTFTVDGVATGDSIAWLSQATNDPDVAGDDLNLTGGGAVAEEDDVPEVPEEVDLTGPRGERGLRGPAGSDGDDGADGSDGAAGATGPAGADGSDGAAGATGPAGADGAAGDAGPTGPTGPAGSAGAKGADGDSGGSGLAIVALILAIVALAGVGGAFAMSRRS